MKITYLYHSGFAVETEQRVLVFDYYTQGATYDNFDPKKYEGKPIYVFSSHCHEDHSDWRMYTWQEDVTKYILSSDIRPDRELGGKLLRTEPHQSFELDGMHIETLESNDEGVAYLVKADGKTIYHAGDLAWWHWNGDRPSANEAIKESYQREIDRMKGEKIDVAFVPADLRLEDKYSWTAKYFMDAVGADVLFPMHFWRRYDVCGLLRKELNDDRVMIIDTEGQEFQL